MKRFLGKKSDKKSSGPDDENPYATAQNQGFQAEDAYSRRPSFAPSYSSAAPSYMSTARPGELAAGPRGMRDGPAPSSSSSYATAHANPYASPYATPNAPAPAASGYGNGAAGGYGNERAGGYGNERAGGYGNERAGGYGGNAYNTPPYGAGQNSLNRGYGGGGAGNQAAASEAYGGYGARRELTEEEKEEEAVQDINREANEVREDSVQITRRGVAMAYQMLEVGTGTGEKLDEQTHRFENMKSNLHTGGVQTRQAAQQARHLQRANGSMWNPANYVGKKERLRQAQQHTDDGTRDLAQQDVYRQERFENLRDMEDQKKAVFARKGQLLGNAGGGSRAKNYDKFLLETDDVEQRDKEDELDANLDEMSFVLSKVKLVADANLKKVDKHMQTIGDITDMSHSLEAKVRRVNNDLGTMK